MTDSTNSALIAATQASEAVAELLRFHREGSALFGPFGEVEVVEKLAEAVAIACEIELRENFNLSATAQDQDSQDYRAALEQLRDAARHFIQGWAA